MKIRRRASPRAGVALHPADTLERAVTPKTPDDEQRLSQISTHWSLIFRAHQDTEPTKKAAQAELLHRYRGAIYRYVRSAVEDPDVAMELCQRFAYRFVRGDFHRAHPSEGRFRNLVKTAVAHLIADWRREQRSRPRTLDSAHVEALASPEPEVGQKFKDLWRAELIDLAWARLAELEATREGSWFCIALRHRVENPEQSAAEMAHHLGQQLKLSLTEANVWKTLERARRKFASLLLDEVARSLGAPTPEQLREEVIELGMHTYCQPALAKRGLS